MQWVNNQWFSPTSMKISFPLRSHRRCEGRMVQMLSHIHEDNASLGSHRRCEGMVQMLSHIHEDKTSLGSHQRCKGWMVQLSVTQVTIGHNFWQAIWDKFESCYYMVKVVSGCGNDIFQREDPRILKVITFIVLNWIRWFKSLLKRSKFY
jgi:hypothetical protein